MKYLTDLHIHSTASDGQHSPRELVRMAKEHGLEVIALTDHDTTDGIDEAVSAGRELGVRVLPGVELSAREYKNFHILGYCYDLPASNLCQLCEKQQLNRIRREDAILDFLRSKGFGLTLAEVKQAASGNVIGRPHFAQVLVNRGYVENRRDAFNRFLDTEEFWKRVPRLEEDARSCIRAIKDSGGKASLAHPYQMKLSDQELDSLVGRLAGWGLDAIECYYPKYTLEQQTQYLYLAKKYSLQITGGSDFHGEKVKPEVQMANWELELGWLLDEM